MDDALKYFHDFITNSATNQTPVRIKGGGTKDFYGLKLEGDVLNTKQFSGIVDYEPSELVLTARAGTKLSEIEDALSIEKQILPFEPPHFGKNATFGGCIAAGFSGPRRAYTGSARDFVLGVRMMNSLGQDLSFGGQVMKNVAGYDLSRLITGSFGTLGLILETSIKVLPLPDAEKSIQFQYDEKKAINKMNELANQSLPVSASCFLDGALYIRLSGAEPAVSAAQKKIGGDSLNAENFWEEIKNHSHKFFKTDKTLWRISVKPTNDPLNIGHSLIEWNGAQRWVLTDLPNDAVQDIAKKNGGYAIKFRSPEGNTGEQPIRKNLVDFHKNLKKSIDPKEIFGLNRIHNAF